MVFFKSCFLCTHMHVYYVSIINFKNTILYNISVEYFLFDEIYICIVLYVTLHIPIFLMDLYSAFYLYTTLQGKSLFCVHTMFYPNLMLLPLPKSLQTN